MKKLIFTLFSIAFLFSTAFPQIEPETPAYPDEEVFIDSASVPFGQAEAPPLLTSISGFEAFQRTNGIIINWKSLEEDNNGGFQVLHSQDGVRWSILKFFPGQNESYRPFAEYQYFDRNPARGENFYRLRKIFLDGSSAWSPPVKVRFSGTAANYGFSVYPNPVSRSTEIFVKLEGFGVPTTVYLSDMNGQLLDQYFISENKTRLSLGDLTPGAYVLNARDGERKFTEKLIVR